MAEELAKSGSDVEMIFSLQLQIDETKLEIYRFQICVVIKSC